MSNFLDLDASEEPSVSSSEPARTPGLKELLTRVPIASPPTRLHPEVSDRLAAQHGFSSREASPPAKVVGGRRHARGVAVEETRQLSIRMPLSLYNDFLDFADSRKMTYNEAIRTLLDGR
ncbi:MAG: hypothetical protein ACRYFU_16755 [Janthinobacterium lividum]